MRRSRLTSAPSPYPTRSGSSSTTQEVGWILGRLKTGDEVGGQGHQFRRTVEGCAKNGGLGDLFCKPRVFGPDQIEHQRWLSATRQQVRAAFAGAFGQPPPLRQ